MNAVILAGGYAQRLWPLTRDYPKALLRIAGKPVITYLLENLSKVPDITQVVVAVDDSRKGFFIEAMHDINTPSSITPQLSTHKEHSDGSLKGPLEKLRELYDRVKDFGLKDQKWLVVGADNVFGLELSRFTNFSRNKEISIAIQRVSVPIQSSQFGVPTLDRTGKVVAFEEKPKEKAFTDISTACYVLNAEVMGKIAEYLESKGDDNLGRYFFWLHSRKRVDEFRFEDPWFDIGTRNDLLAANAFLMGWPVENQQEPLIVLGKTQIHSPVWIHDTATVFNSVVGPSVYVGPGVQIVNSQVENSIIYENTTIRSSVIKDSVIGGESVIEGKISEAVFGPRSAAIGE